MESGKDNSICVVTVARTMMPIETRLGNPSLVVVAAWECDDGEDYTYYCPKCHIAMTKKAILEWAQYAKSVVPGYHVYHRGKGDYWDCGPLRFYKQGDNTNPIYAH